MKLYIQNMVSLRCKMMVRSELEKLDIAFKSIELGEVQLSEAISELYYFYSLPYLSFGDSFY